ncbi:MAG: hypothetical protein VX589_15330 [Myxococcota bacterium]|nr:hypothetical protein [Myxococcota bacterium]
MSVEPFLRDPVKYLNSPQYNKGNGLLINLSGPGGALPDNAQPINVPDPDNRYAKFRRMPVHMIRAETVSQYIKLTTGPWSLDISPNPSAGTKTVPSYYLNWAPDKACAMRLGQSANAFFTAPLNGCAILINGDRASPTVVHANITIGDILPAPPSFDSSVTGPYEKEKMALFYQYYLNLGTGLVDGGVFTGTSGTTQMFDPLLYYKYQGGKAKVFGLRQPDGWTFYYSMEQRVSPTSIKYLSGQLWPKLATP